MKHTPLGFFRAVLAVLAAFIGIRRRKKAEDDANLIHPVHIIVAGICMVILFISIVRFAVKFAIQT